MLFKKESLLLVVIFLLTPLFLFAADVDDFILVIKTNYPGASSNTEFFLPVGSTTGSGYNVDCNNDGTNEATGVTGNAGYTCSYGSVGTYTIRVKDNNGDHKGFRKIKFNNKKDVKKILEIKQWGSTLWSSMASSFKGAKNMTITAMDVPDFSNLGNGTYASLQAMFKNCKKLTTLGNDNWDMSRITNMQAMFSGTDNANPDVSTWDTSKVLNMRSMFLNALKADPDVSTWDTGKVKDMSKMFMKTSMANPDVSNWDTSALTNIKNMFNNATSFDRDMSEWDVSLVTDARNFLLGVQLTQANYDSLLSSWGNQAVISGTHFHGGNSQYCSGKDGHDSLANTFGWIITDHGLNCGGVCAGAHGSLTKDHWTTISFPCATGNNGVEALIGTAICNGVTPCSYGDDQNWTMYQQGTDFSGTSSSMIPLASSDLVKPGKGYWIISDHNTTWHIDGNLSNLNYSPTVSASSLNINSPNFDYVYKRDLPASGTDQQKLLLGNPFPHDINFSDVYFSHVINIFTAMYQNGTYVNDVVYTYDAIGTSAPYKAISANTPGIDKIIQQQGFWLRLKPGQTGDNNITFPKAK